MQLLSTTTKSWSRDYYSEHITKSWLHNIIIGTLFLKSSLTLFLQKSIINLTPSILADPTKKGLNAKLAL